MKVSDEAIAAMDVKKEAWDKIYAEVKIRMEVDPEERLVIYDIADYLCVSGREVKMVLFTMLALHELVVTFRPRCVNCGAIMGAMEFSAYKVEEGEYECPDCGDSEAEIELIFWKPGALKNLPLDDHSSKML